MRKAMTVALAMLMLLLGAADARAQQFTQWGWPQPYEPVSTSWMDATFKKLGWKIPKEPPYFPAGVTTASFRQALAGGQRLNLILPYRLDAPPHPDPLPLRASGGEGTDRRGVRGS